jgi:hypothetical protein
MPTPEAYSIFDEWYRTCDWILQTCDRMPKHTRFTLNGRIVNLALDVTALLTEAIYRKEDRPDALRRINLLLEQLRIFFRLSKDRRYISLNQYEFVLESINRVGRMTGGWLKQSQT